MPTFISTVTHEQFQEAWDRCTSYHCDNPEQKSHDVEGDFYHYLRGRRWYNPSNDTYTMLEGAAHRCLMLTGPHWYTVIKAYYAKRG